MPFGFPWRKPKAAEEAPKDEDVASYSAALIAKWLYEHPSPEVPSRTQSFTIVGMTRMKYYNWPYPRTMRTAEEDPNEVVGAAVHKLNSGGLVVVFCSDCLVVVVVGGGGCGGGEAPSFNCLPLDMFSALTSSLLLFSTRVG